MSEMGREIRRGMKNVIREKGFKYWLKNVFWYHYGKLFIILLIAIAVAVYITVEGMGGPDFDFQLVMSAGAELGETQTAELEAIIADAVGDINGDGEVQINLQVVAPAADSNSVLQLWLSQPEFALCILEDRESILYGEHDFFDNADSFGFAPDAEHPYRVEISAAPVIERLTESVFGEAKSLYASICDWTAVGKGKQEWTDAAVRALSAILASE